MGNLSNKIQRNLENKISKNTHHWERVGKCIESSVGLLLSQLRESWPLNVRHYFEQHGDARFSIVGAEHDQRTINRSGYKKMIDGCMYYFVLQESFKQDICSGFDYHIAIDILKEKEWLIPGTDGKNTRAENLPCSTSNTRCYRFDEGKIFAEDM